MTQIACSQRWIQYERDALSSAGVRRIYGTLAGWRKCDVFLHSTGCLLHHSPKPPKPFDIMYLLYYVGPGQEHQHLYSPLGNTCIRQNGVKMQAREGESERESFPQRWVPTKVQPWRNTLYEPVYTCVSIKKAYELMKKSFLKDSKSWWIVKVALREIKETRV